MTTTPLAAIMQAQPNHFGTPLWKSVLLIASKSDI
jgi:hypothetical protein